VLEDTKIRNNNDTLYKEKVSLDQRLTQIKILLGSLNKEYKELKQSLDDVNENTVELEEKIERLKGKNREYQEIIDDLELKSTSYDELLKILSFDGIRKSLIQNAITPINVYLSDYLKRLNSLYTAELSDNFDATIYELETLEINSETLSKGEDRKINISIALSYLKIIMDMKHSNVIFLDEIFDGLSMTNIVLILKILKELSIEYKTNIIIVAHGISEMKDFNKIVNNFNYIIEAKKDIFSDLDIKKIN
jgi:DNA repair exonuclease SbcCD ATPase subunit